MDDYYMDDCYSMSNTGKGVVLGAGVVIATIGLAIGIPAYLGYKIFKKIQGSVGDGMARQINIIMKDIEEIQDSEEETDIPTNTVESDNDIDTDDYIRIEETDEFIHSEAYEGED